MQTVAQIQIERPVAPQLWLRLRFHRRPGFGFAMNTRCQSVGALAGDDATNGHGANHMIASAIERDAAGSLDIAPNVAIGVDPEHEHAPVDAVDALVDRRQSTRDVAFERCGQRWQSEFDRRGNSRLGHERGGRVWTRARLIRRERRRSQKHANQRGQKAASRRHFRCLDRDLLRSNRSAPTALFL
jgi:hypothetical protein